MLYSDYIKVLYKDIDGLLEECGQLKQMNTYLNNLLSLEQNKNKLLQEENEQLMGSFISAK